MTMRRLRIAQIGICHEHAAAKMRSLRSMPDAFEVVGVVDERAATAASARRAGDDLAAYDGLPWLDEATVLAMPGLDAVLVETPNADLVPTALRCLDRGLPMHMDKPAGWDLAAFERLLAGCDARGLPFQMGFMFRSNPAFAFCEQAVREGWIGDVHTIRADMGHDYGGEAYQRYLGRMPGGIMFNLGCHLIDAVVGLMGRPLQVQPLNLSTADATPGTANLCQATLVYAHAIATIAACSRTVGGLDGRRLLVCGGNGSIELSPLERFDGRPLTLQLTLREARGGHPAGPSVIDLGARQDRYRDQLLEFAGMVRSRFRGRHGSAHDRLVHAVTLAASGCTPWPA